MNPAFSDAINWAKARNDDSGWWVQNGKDRFAFSVVWPGFDDSGVLWGPGGKARIVDFTTREYPADELAFYRATQAAAVSHTDQNPWVLIATLNDWNESTHIEPSREKGYAFAIATKQFAETFKAIPEEEKQPDSILQTITETDDFSAYQ